jgi:hypothetical protein
MLKILDILRNSVSRSDVPCVHLFRYASSIIELACSELTRYGYSNSIHPQSDLGKEIQSLNKSLRVMFCPTRKAEVKYQFDLVDDFSIDSFSCIKSYPPGSGVTFQLANRIYGLIPKARLLDCAHAPAIKITIMLSSKLTQISWRLVDSELWGRSAAKLSTTKLLAVVKFIHKEWPTGHMLHRHHKTDPGCPHCGEYEYINHIFTCPSLVEAQGRTSAVAAMPRNLDGTKMGLEWTAVYQLILLGMPMGSIPPLPIASKYEAGLKDQMTIGMLNFDQGKISIRLTRDM